MSVAVVLLTPDDEGCVKGGKPEPRARQNVLLEVPYTTAQTGLVRGGVALNTVPNVCEFDFEIRDLPGTDVGRLVRNIKAFGTELATEQSRYL